MYYFPLTYEETFFIISFPLLTKIKAMEPQIIPKKMSNISIDFPIKILEITMT